MKNATRHAAPVTVVLHREDFTSEANALQIWEALTIDAGLPADTEAVEVMTVRRAE